MQQTRYMRATFRAFTLALIGAAALTARSAAAQGPYIGEITFVAFNVIPKGWAEERRDVAGRGAPVAVRAARHARATFVTFAIFVASW